MYCPNCGANLPDDVTFCPHCGTVLEKEKLSSNDYSSENIAPEMSVQHEVGSQQNLEEKLYDFFKANQNSAFTVTAIFNRMKKDTNISDQDFLLTAIETELYKMVRNGLLKVEHRNSEKFYSLYQKDSLTVKEDASKIQSHYEPSKPFLIESGTDSGYKRSKRIAPGVVALIILGLVGLGLLIGGILGFVIPYGYFIFTSNGLTLVIIGAILLIIVLGITSKGECCDCCDSIDCC